MKQSDEHKELARIIANAQSQSPEVQPSSSVELLNHLVKRAVDNKCEDKLRDYGRRLSAIYLESFWLNKNANSE
jgi:hypothetical protein